MHENLSAQTAAGVWQRETRRLFRLILKLERATRAGKVEALHDLRVAIRRLRVLLRALDKPLARTTARKLLRRWGDIMHDLSPRRDADVWRILLEDLPEISSAFRQRVLQRMDRNPIPSANLLSSLTWQRLKRDTQTLLKKEAADALAQPAKAKPHRALCKTWKQATARAAKLAHSRQLAQPEAAHKLRIACRRARYLAEFFTLTTARGKHQRHWRKIARRYLAVQTALGRTHDTDTLLEFLKAQHLHPPAKLHTALIQRRTQGLADFRKCWRKLAARP